MGKSKEFLAKIKEMSPKGIAFGIREMERVRKAERRKRREAQKQQRSEQ